MTASATNVAAVLNPPPAGPFTFATVEAVKPEPPGKRGQTWGGVKVDESGCEIKELNARRLFDVERPPPGDRSELLKTRFLCRGGGCLLVGQTGQGKSSLAMQATLCFAVGRPLFGIVPNGPLRCVLLQGENDDGDLTEARDGVALWLDVEEDDEKTRALLKANTLVVSENALAGDDLFASLSTLLEREKPDLMIIDPAFSYVKGDASNAKDVGAFLRQGLNPLLSARDCGCLVVHHTGKPPTQKGAVNTQGTAYAGFGSSEWANWARAILTLEGVGYGRYKLHAAKRGSRLGWKDGEGKPAFAKMLEHSKNAAGFCWEEVTEEAAATAVQPKGAGLPELMELVPLSEAILKTELQQKAQKAGIAEKRFRALLEKALDAGDLHEWTIPRPGARPFKKLARIPQPETLTDA